MLEQGDILVLFVYRILFNLSFIPEVSKEGHFNIRCEPLTSFPTQWTFCPTRVQP